MRRMVALVFLVLLLLTTCLTGCAGAPQSRESGATAVVSVLGVEPAGEGIRLLAAAEGRGREAPLPGRQPGGHPAAAVEALTNQGERVVSCAHVEHLLLTQTAAATLPALLSYAFQEPQQSTETQLWVVQADTLAESFSGGGDTAQRMTVIQSQGKDRQTFAPSPSGRPPRPWPRGELPLIPALSVGEAGLAFAGFALYQDGAITRWLTGPAALGGRPPVRGRRSTGPAPWGRRPSPSRAPAPGASGVGGQPGGGPGPPVPAGGGPHRGLDGGGHRPRPPWSGRPPRPCRRLWTSSKPPGRTPPACWAGRACPTLPVGCPQRAVAGGLSHPAGHLHGDRSRGPGPVRPEQARRPPRGAEEENAMKNRTIAWSQLSAVLLCWPSCPWARSCSQAAWPRWGRRPGCAPSWPGWGWWPWGCWCPAAPPGRRDWGAGDPPLGPPDGPGAGGGLPAVGALPGAAHAERIGDRLSDSLRAAPVLLTAAVLLLAGWMAAGGLPAFARACEVFLLAVGAGFVLILLFGIFRLDWSLTLLWTREELAQVPAGALSTAGDHGGRGYALFLLGGCAAGGRGARMGCPPAGPAVCPAGGGRCSWFWVSWAAPWRSRWTGPSCKWSPAWGLRGFPAAGGAGLRPVGAGDVALLGLLLLCLGRPLAWLLDRPVGKGKSWPLTGAVFLLGLPAALGDHPLAGTWVSFGNLAVVGLLVLTLLGTGEEKKLEKSEKKGLTFLDGRGILSKLSQDRGEKAGRKEEKNFLTKASSCSKIQFTRESGVHLVN